MNILDELCVNNYLDSVIDQKHGVTTPNIDCGSNGYRVLLAWAMRWVSEVTTNQQMVWCDNVLICGDIYIINRYHYTFRI